MYDQVEVMKPKWRRDGDEDHIATGAVRGDNGEYLRAVCLVRAIAVVVGEVDGVCGVVVVLDGVLDGCGWRM